MRMFQRHQSTPPPPRCDRHQVETQHQRYIDILQYVQILVCVLGGNNVAGDTLVILD